jgi:hypothetical protein
VAWTSFKGSVRPRDQRSQEIAVLGRELDRSKGAGKTHDAERDPGHCIDLYDNGDVRGVLSLANLAVTREAYDTELRAKGFTQYKAGYLPYSIVDGWQQIRKDFAYWRDARYAHRQQLQPVVNDTNCAPGISEACYR